MTSLSRGQSGPTLVESKFVCFSFDLCSWHHLICLSFNYSRHDQPTELVDGDGDGAETEVWIGDDGPAHLRKSQALKTCRSGIRWNLATSGFDGSWFWALVLILTGLFLSRKRFHFHWDAVGFVTPMLKRIGFPLPYFCFCDAEGKQWRSFEQERFFPDFYGPGFGICVCVSPALQSFFF